MSKVFVLALDGLEYDLVEKWRLRNLMQSKYGKIILSSDYYHKDVHVPYTPIIWASFITGVPPERHGIKDFFTYGKTLDFIRNLPVIRWIKGKKKILRKIGMKPRTVEERDLNVKTIFDIIKPSIAVDVPAYNEPAEYFYRRNKALKDRGLKGYEEEIWKIHKERKKKVFENLQKDWKLFMAYFTIADLMGHLHIAKRLRRLKIAYDELDVLASKLKEALPEDTVFLVISDHGMKPESDGTGSHSSHAFYSLNIETDWEPKDITDFHKKIIDFLK